MKLIEYKQVNGNIMHDAHLYAVIELNDGSVHKVKAYPPCSDNGWKWEYDTCGSDRHWETVWAFRELLRPKPNYD